MVVVPVLITERFGDIGHDTHEREHHGQKNHSYCNGKDGYQCGFQTGNHSIHLFLNIFIIANRNFSHNIIHSAGFEADVEAAFSSS